MGTHRVKNMIFALSLSKVPLVSFIISNWPERMEIFFGNVAVAPAMFRPLVEGPEREAEEMCHRVFPNGWLSPRGQFVRVRMSEHEDTASEVTGKGSVIEACKAGWVKLTMGVPYGNGPRHLFDPEADRGSLTTEQKRWLNDWIKGISVQGAETIF